MLLQTSLHLLNSQEVGGDVIERGVSLDSVGGATLRSAGGDASEAEEEEKNDLHPLTDDSLEGSDGTTFHLPGFHGDETGLELAL